MLNIPDGWTVKKLHETGEAIIGLTYSPKDVVDEGGIVVLRSSNVQGGRITLDDLVRVNSKIPKKLLLQKGDILVCARNGSRRLIGKNAYIDESNAGKTFGAFMCVYRSDSAEYMYWIFQTDSFKKQVARDLGPTINQVTTGNLNSFKFPFPDKPTQQIITDTLDTWDIYLQKIDEKIKLKKKIKRGLMQQLLTGKKRLHGFSDEWEVKTLSKFDKLQHGDGDWILSENISENGKYKIVQLGSIGFGRYINKTLKTVSEEDFIKINGTPLKNGDLLINRMVDGSLNLCIFEENGDYVTSVDVCWIRKNDFLDNYFLMHLMMLDVNQSKLLTLSSGSGRVRISKKNLFTRFIFKVPSIEEQRAISKILAAADYEIKLLEVRRSIVEEQKIYLVNNLVTGKMLVPKTMGAKHKEAVHA
jgi:type I restriction enzyme S subunit